MLKTILHHTYRNGRAADVSRSGNHGKPIDTLPGPGAQSLALNGRTSRVWIEPSEGLSNFDGVRIKLRFHPGFPSRFTEQVDDEFLAAAPGGVVPVARWVMLADMSLAGFPRRPTPDAHVVIPPDEEVQPRLRIWYFQVRTGSAHDGAIRIGTSRRGLLHAALPLTDSGWHEVEFAHDGVTTAELRVDGQRADAVHDVLGPFPGVGSAGMAFGGPLTDADDPSKRVGLIGLLGEAQIQHRDLDPEELIDPCCADLPALDELVSAAARDGFTAESLKQTVGEIRVTEATIRSRVIGNNDARAEKASDLAELGVSALMRGDMSGAVNAAIRTIGFMREAATDSEITELGQRALGQLKRLPFGNLLTELAETGQLRDTTEANKLLRSFCLPSLPERPEPERPHEDHRSADEQEDRPPPLLDELRRGGGLEPGDSGSEG